MTSADSAGGAPLDIVGPPGVTYRGFRGAEDIPGMVRANMAARRHDGIFEAVTVEETAHRYAHLTNSDPDRDVVIVEIDGEIVGFGRNEWADDNDGSRTYTFFCLLDPAVRGRAIGDPILQWQERRIRAIAAGQVTDRPRFFASFAWDADRDVHALITSAGYAVVRQDAEMVRPNLEAIPTAPIPGGIEIRPGRIEDARLLWAANIEIFRDHWGWVDDSEGGYERLVSDPNLDPSLWLIAWADSQIAGIVECSLQPGRDPGTTLGYLDTVGVRRPWRRIGLGRALVGASLRLLRDRGATSAALGVDTQNENEAQHLYERMGFAVESRARNYRKPLVLDAAE